VHDSTGKSLIGYFLSVERAVGMPTERLVGELPSNVEYRIQGIQLPVIDAEGRFTADGLAPGDYMLKVMGFDLERHVWLGAKWPVFHLAEEEGAHAEVEIELEACELRYGIAVFDDGKPVTKGGWTTWFSRQPPDAMSGNFASDGSFRVHLSKWGREHLQANSNGTVELYSYGDDDKSARAEVRFHDLSADPLHPTKVVLRWRETKPAEHAVEAAPQRDKWKLAAGDVVDFKLVDTKGQTHRLADYRGKVVWLNFFGTGCAPCLREWPHLAELSKEQIQAGLVVLAVCSEPADVVEEFTRRREPPFTVLVDGKRQAVAKFFHDVQSQWLPTNILIDRDGRLAHQSEDFSDERFAELTAKARELLARQPTAKSQNAD
jgi:peroxiredoxin